jgi:hypothetical protein
VGLRRLDKPEVMMAPRFEVAYDGGLFVFWPAGFNLYHKNRDGSADLLPLFELLGVFESLEPPEGFEI